MVPRSPPQPPPRRIAANNILPTMQRIMDEYRRVRDAVCQQTDPYCFENAILPMLQVTNQTSGEFTMVALMRYCAPDLQSRLASEAAVKLATEASAERNARKDLCAVIYAVQKKREILEPEEERHLEQLCIKYKRSGRGALDDQTMNQYLATHKLIKSLCQQYGRTIMDNDAGLWVSAQDLDGVPKSYIERFFSKSSSDGEIFLPFRNQENDILLQYVQSPSIRKVYYLARSRQFKDNVDTFREVMLARHRCASTLGHKNHAEFKLQSRMIKSVDSIEEFLGYIENALLERGKIEVDALVAMRNEHFQSSPHRDDYPDCMPPWDLPFFSRLAKEKQESGVGQIKNSEYFPLELVVASLLQTITHCLGLQFERLTVEEMTNTTWHEDVMGWSVWEEEDESSPDLGEDFVGYLFMDLLSRENKYKGSQNPSLHSVSAL